MMQREKKSDDRKSRTVTIFHHINTHKGHQQTIK